MNTIFSHFFSMLNSAYQNIGILGALFIYLLGVFLIFLISCFLISLLGGKSNKNYRRGTKNKRIQNKRYKAGRVWNGISGI